MKKQDAFDILTPLTFAIVAQSNDCQLVSAPGSGFFIAPYTAITAKHVDFALWDELEMPWKKGRYPTTSVQPEYFMKPMQVVDIRNPNDVAVWEITGVTPCNHTDASFLHVVPDNAAAHRLQWASGFPELELLAPRVGEEVWAFGYPGSKLEHRPGESRIILNSIPTLVSGRVLEIFENGRPGWPWPAFRTDALFEPGLSGSPVLHDGKICGIVSYGASYAEGGQDAYAATLWPLLLSETEASIDPRQRNAPVLDFLRAGQLHAAGWSSLKQRAYLATGEDGRMYPKLRSQ